MEFHIEEYMMFLFHRMRTDRHSCLLIIWGQSRENFGSLRFVLLSSYVMYKNLSYCNFFRRFLSRSQNFLFLLQIFCFWNSLWLLSFVRIAHIVVFLFCDYMKISLTRVSDTVSFGDNFKSTLMKDFSQFSQISNFEGKKCLKQW